MLHTQTFRIKLSAARQHIFDILQIDFRHHPLAQMGLSSLSAHLLWGTSGLWKFYLPLS